MPTLKQRLNAAIGTYKEERDKQTKQEIAEMKAKARKINGKAKTAEDKKKTQAELSRANARLRKAKSSGSKKDISIFDYLK
jgi:F0F1-type ATP synthase epsilon subunit